MNDRIRAILQGLRLDIRVDTQDAKREVAGMLKRAQNRGPLLERIAEIMRLDVALQFKVGGVPTWAPLKAATIASKKRMGYARLNRKGKKGEYASQSLTPYGEHGVLFGPTAVLIRTGALFSSWTSKDDGDHITEFDGDSVRIGTSLAYAAAHQCGGTRLPKRAITITDEARRQVDREARLYIETGEMEK